MKTNGVPAIIMLAAGFIDCVIAILGTCHFGILQDSCYWYLSCFM